MNGLQANKVIWASWDGSRQGDESTISPEWKLSVVRNFIDPYFMSCKSILEIGPGAGRWTKFLIPKAQKFVGIDISETCVAECRNRLSNTTALLVSEFMTECGFEIEDQVQSWLDAGVNILQDCIPTLSPLHGRGIGGTDV